MALLSSLRFAPAPTFLAVPRPSRSEQLSRDAVVAAHRRIQARGHQGAPRPLSDDWRDKARPKEAGSVFPAKELCSDCGLCQTYYIHHVKDACAFLGDGMSRVTDLEKSHHGRARDLNDPLELRYGVTQANLYARNQPGVEGAQWTGIVTQVAMDMLQSGMVDAVVCVQGDENDPRHPKPVVAFTVEDIIKAKGVKPTLSPNLKVLATIEALQVKKLLFIGVGCHVQALRNIQKHLPLDELYVMGTNCTDNGTREGLQKFLNHASKSPDTAKHYEFLLDFRVHIKHEDGHYEKVPYFSLPADELSDVIAPSCLSCFDYTNGAADLVVGYMGVPPGKEQMTNHFQHVIVRNERGRKMLDSIKHRLETKTPTASGDARPWAMQTALQDLEARQGKGKKPMPLWLGNIMAAILGAIGPKGLTGGQYSVDYHYLRNKILLEQKYGAKRAAQHMPVYAKKIFEAYDGEKGMLTKKFLPDPLKK